MTPAKRTPDQMWEDWKKGTLRPRARAYFASHSNSEFFYCQMPDFVQARNSFPTKKLKVHRTGSVYFDTKDRLIPNGKIDI
jgi:hypothetical protein